MHVLSSKVCPCRFLGFPEGLWEAVRTHTPPSHPLGGRWELLSGAPCLMLGALHRVLLGTVWVAVGLCGVPWNMDSESAPKRNTASELLGKNRFYLVTAVRGRRDRI